MNVFFFGDSIFFGQFISPHKTFVTRISQKLEEFNNDIKVTNSSISGDTTRIALERMEHDIKPTPVDVILIQFGINDSNYWQTGKGLPRVSKKSFEANLIEIIEYSRTFGAKKIFIATNHPTNTMMILDNGNIPHQKGNKEYNRIIRKVAEKTGVQLIDIEKEFFKKTKNGKILRNPLLTDGVHLSKYGHKIYFSIIYPFVKEAVKTIMKKNKYSFVKKKFTSKSKTDNYWNKQVIKVKNDINVNIMDIFQRNLEYDFIKQYLKKNMKVLEVGCGNGFSTAHFRVFVKQIDAFDYSENMIKHAKVKFGETNNHFIYDNILNPKHISKDYDAVICVRVLINLKDLEQQKLAIKNLIKLLKFNGILILIEGFTEGFIALNQLRAKVSLPPLEPAKMNLYSSINDIMPILKENFKLENEFHIGIYDYLTRVTYPLIAGIENVKHNTIFSEKSEKLARVYNPDVFKKFSRVRGFVLRKMYK